MPASENNICDINCDMGEADSIRECQSDLKLMPFISRCNIAVGGHIGNEKTMAYSFKNAQQHNLYIGLHPSYPDRANFGRQRLDVNDQALISSLTEQIDKGLNVAQQCQVSISHIKFHGALYNDLERDPELAQLVAKSMTKYKQLKMMGLADGLLKKYCSEHQLSFINEGFADRRYASTQQLQPRAETGAVLSDPEQASTQALQMAQGEAIISSTGEPLTINAESICVHSDTENAQQVLKAISQKLALANRVVAKAN